MCDLGISGDGDEMRVSFNRLFPFETVTKISLSMAAVLQSVDKTPLYFTKYLSAERWQPFLKSLYL